MSGPLNARALNSRARDGLLPSDPFAQFLLQYRRPMQVLVAIQAGELAEVPTTDERAIGQALNERAINDSGSPPGLAAQRTLLFSNRPLLFPPWDAMFPNRFAEPRIVEFPDVERAIPLFPETSRRATLSLGELTLADADRQMTRLFQRYSVGGRVASIYVGPAHGHSGDFRLVQAGLASRPSTSGGVLRIAIEPISNVLDVPLQRAIYSGRGGIDGDPSLAGQRKPLLFGEAFNIAPLLLNQDQTIFQVHAGAILAVDALRDIGLPLTYAGDVPTYAALRLTDVENGTFRTCLALGLIKASFGGAGPQGEVRADVRGDVSRGGYTDQTGEILLRVALRAGVPPSEIDFPSFFTLPDYPIGFFYDGLSDSTAAAVFDSLLAPCLGFYGSSRALSLTARPLLNPPSQFSAVAAHIRDGDVIESEELRLTEPPRGVQAVAFARNWAPLSPDQISDALLDAALRERLTLPSQTVERAAGEAYARNNDSVLADRRRSTLQSYFRDEGGAAAIAERALSLFSDGRRVVRLVIPRWGYQLDIGRYVLVDNVRLALQNRVMLIAGLRDVGSRALVELTLWG